MSLRISGKNMDIGDALRERIEDRIEEAVLKYFDGGYNGHVTVEKSGSGFGCDCTVHLDTGVVLQGTSFEPDATGSFEAAAERVEKRLRRYKRRLKNHHAGGGQRDMSDVAYAVIESLDDGEVAEDFSPITIAETSTPVFTQSVAEAVMQLDLTDRPVVVFTNAANGQTNVVYRRADGNIGWIDPSRANR